MSENWYINFVKTSLEVIRNSHVPLRSSKFSKKKYTQHQLLTLIILKEKIGKDYRDFTELLPNLTTITDIIQLEEIPHYTTLQKFLQFSVAVDDDAYRSGVAGDFAPVFSDRTLSPQVSGCRTSRLLSLQYPSRQGRRRVQEL